MTLGRSAQPLVDAAMLEAPARRRLLLRSLARALGVAAATVLLYALLPIRSETALAVIVMSGLGLVIVGIVFGRQLTRISRAPQPVLAAIEALVLVLGLFLVFFAFTYVSLSVNDPAAFTQPVDKVAGMYFSITILATVGFGDIAATSDVARVIVTLQMLLDLVLIGVAVRLLGTSARRAVEERSAASEDAGSSPPDGAA
jgi:hypothetical protein